MTRYLNEIRLGREKNFFRNIIQDVRKEFDLSSHKRPVPHITLFGPYNTQQGNKAKRRTRQVLSNYRVVPFRVCGFDSFRDSNVVYANVEASNKLQMLRHELATSLRPVVYNYRSWDFDDHYEFHITIATDLDEQLMPVLQYVQREYEVDIELYATRFPVLDRRQIMWEWDLPRGVELSSQKATSKESWEKTMQELNRIKNQSRSTAVLNRILPWR